MSHPPVATATPLQRLREALRSPQALSLAELSQLVSVSEKDLPGLLDKLQRSKASRLEVAAPRCLSCNFSFDQRKRFTRPSRCPQCRSERIAPLRVRLG